MARIQDHRPDDWETQQRTFVVMNERPVDDISLEFFYKPHTITLVLVSIIGVMYFAFIRSVYYLQFFIVRIKYRI